MNHYKVYTVALILALLFLLFFLFKKSKDNKILKSQIGKQKELIFEKDSMITVKEGIYSKIVVDNNKQKEILKKLKSENKRLYKTIKNRKESPIIYKTVYAQPEKQIDTVIVEKIIEREKEVILFTSNYPKVGKSYIQTTTKLTGDTAITNWKFNPLRISLVINETAAGVYTSILDAPSWIGVQDIEVNSIPISKNPTKNFNWVLGGGVGIVQKLTYPRFTGYGGVRYKKGIFAIGADSQGKLDLNYFILL